MKTGIILFLLILLFHSGTQAQTVVATSHSDDDVQAAIDVAVDGDTVEIPIGDGSEPWDDGVRIPGTKGIILAGPGAGNLVLYDDTSTSEPMVSVMTGESFVRITGIAFDGQGGSFSGPAIDISGTGAGGWRIDHSQWENAPSGGHPIEINGKTYGVIDNNTFINCYSGIALRTTSSWTATGMTSV